MLDSETKASEPDPHHIVALLNFTFRKDKDASVPQVDHTLYDLKDGIADDHETNVRTFPVMDALASVAVSREKSGAVAVGLQMNLPKNEIRLTISNNTAIKDGLVVHMRSLWGKLQLLSDEYDKDRAKGPDSQCAGSEEIPV